MLSRSYKKSYPSSTQLLYHAGNLLGVRADPAYSKTKVFFYIRMRVNVEGHGITNINSLAAIKQTLQRQSIEKPIENIMTLMERITIQFLD